MVFLSAGGKTYRTMEVMTIKNSSSFRMHINRDHCNLYETMQSSACVICNIIVEFKMVIMRLGRAEQDCLGIICEQFVNYDLL